MAECNLVVDLLHVGGNVFVVVAAVVVGAPIVCMLLVQIMACCVLVCLFCFPR